MESNASVLILFAAILIVAGVILALIMMRKDGAKQINQDKYRSKWLEIEHSLSRDQEHSYSLAVLNADKLVDQAMREKGIAGNTMGERMKNSAQVFSNRNAIWSAHKLRNQIAHESDVSVSYDSSRRALASFKQALKDLGAI